MHTSLNLPTRAAAAVLLLVLGFALAACGSSSKKTTSTGSTASNTSNSLTPPPTTTTAAPPVVSGTDKSAFCQEAKNLITFNAGTGKQADIEKAMPAINNLVKIAPAEIKTQVTHIASIFQTVASGGKLTAANVPKTLQQDIKDYKAYVVKNCPSVG